MEPAYFASPNEFRAWLEAHHGDVDKLWVGYFKRATGRPSLTWPESVDEALCYGWIDGVRRRVDEERYAIRFTPRRSGSVWSQVNLERVAALTAEGRMRPAGLAIHAARRADATPGPPRAERPEHLPLPYERALRERNEDAWRFFASQSGSYRRTLVDWVLAAKREETRVRRAERIADALAGGQRWMPGEPLPTARGS
ncbi:MAG: YdeI/OmpD-associated family protein [Trueperaceae bacterium]|nr:YdeI/OmpD-associated family protein [Trueperaceae bacterium]